MCIPDMLCLRSIQSKILYGVVPWVTVYVVDNLARFKIAAEILLHNIAVFKNVLKAARLMTIGRIWMIVRGDNQRVSVFSYFSAPLPSRTKFFPFAEHGVISTHHTLAEHRVIFPTNVSLIGGVRICQIGKGAGATFRTELARASMIAFNILPTLFTLNDRTCEMSFSWHTPIIACGR